MYMQTLDSFAGIVSRATLSHEDLSAFRDLSPILHATLALLLLLIATMLAVYKPPGLTPYGRRKQNEERTV